MASPNLRVSISAVFLLIPVVLSMGIDPSQLDHNSLAANTKNKVPFEGKSPIMGAPVYSDNEVMESSWTDTFKRALQGPTGQMVVHIAKEVIARQVGGAQVLSLNLTNVLILLFLKAIIFAAGLVGAGSWGQYARSLDNGRPVIDFGDASMMMGFLAAQGSGHNNCLYRAACEYPDAGLEYTQAGHATLTGFEIFSRNSSDPRYENLLTGMEKAAKEGMRNAPCNLLYKCPL